jgi:hypothetical protein
VTRAAWRRDQEIQALLEAALTKMEGSLMRRKTDHCRPVLSFVAPLVAEAQQVRANQHIRRRILPRGRADNTALHNGSCGLV